MRGDRVWRRSLALVLSRVRVAAREHARTVALMSPCLGESREVSVGAGKSTS